MDVCHTVEREASAEENKKLIKINNFAKKVNELTAKYGLHADSTTLCALRNFPSAANVQSTNVPFSKSVSNTLISVL